MLKRATRGRPTGRPPKPVSIKEAEKLLLQFLSTDKETQALLRKTIEYGNLCFQKGIEHIEQINPPPITATIKEIELWHINRVHDSLKGNKTRTAKSLAIGLKTLYRKLGYPK